MKLIWGAMIIVAACGKSEKAGPPPVEHLPEAPPAFTAGGEREQAAMKVVYDKCSGFAPWRQGSVLAGKLDPQRGVVAVSVTLKQAAALTEGHDLQYEVRFGGEAVSSFAATTFRSAQMCGMSNIGDVFNVPPPPPPPVDPIVALNLPSKAADANALMGKPLAVATKVIGARAIRLENADHQFDMDGGTLRVVDDRGRIVGLEVVSARAGWDRYDEAQRGAIAKWFGLPNANPEQMVNGRTIVLGDDLLHTGLAVYDKAYREKIEEIAERYRQQAVQMRLTSGRAHLKQLSEEMRKQGFSGAFDVSSLDDTTVTFSGTCTQEILDDLAKRLGPKWKESFAFARIACLGMTAKF